MIVVTGAAGLVGNVLVKKLMNNNKKVKAIVTPTDDLRILEKYDLEIRTGDVRDKDFLIREFTGAEQVYHLAGIVSISSGEKELLSGHQITLKQIFHILNNLTGQKLPKVYFPHWLLKLFIPIISFINKRLKKPPTLTSYALYTLSSNSLFSHEKATNELGYHPRHIARTMKETIQWYEKTGKL